MNRVALSILLLTIGNAGHAQAPALSYLFPQGAQRGTTSTVTVGPSSLPADTRVWIEGDGITAGPVKDGKVELTVAADTAPGVRRLRVITAQGASVPRPFVVGVLPEVKEVEPNNLAKDAMAVTLPVTVNGQIMTRNDPDSYRVTLKAGECLVAATEARRIGAPTDLVLRLLDARGVELATCEDYNDRDPLIAYVVPADGDYLVQAYDVMTNYSSVNQDYTYRLTLTTGPYLDRVLPPGVPRGATTRVTLSGWNLDGKPGPGTVAQSLAVSADAARTVDVTLPGAANALPVATGALPDTAEAEPNDDAPHAQPLSLPASVNGTLALRGDVDVYRITAHANERFLFAVEADTLGSPLDGVLSLLDAQGKSLAESDDADGSRDPAIRWTAPADGDYFLRVRDIGTPSRGGPEFVYRLHVDRPRPALALALTEPSPVITPSAKLELSLKLTRRDGATGEVEITADGLPAGVTAEPLKVAANTSAAEGSLTSDVKLTLIAAPDAAPAAAPIRLLARSKAGDQTLAATAVATFVLATDRSGTIASGTTEQLLLVVNPQAVEKQAGGKKK
jgi:hypothetical protein